MAKKKKKIIKKKAKKTARKTKKIVKKIKKPKKVVKKMIQPSAMLREENPAPDFRAPTDRGDVVSLADFRGKKLVLYFYPKDDTPGCTVEACAFRDGISEIQSRGAVVLGVSTDSVGSHEKFRDKYNLNFPLLSDENRKIVEDYGVWKEKSMYGRTYMGIERTTFLIDEAGKILRIFPKVDVKQHYTEVLQALG